MAKRLLWWLPISALFTTLVLTLSGGWTDPYFWAYCGTWSLIVLAMLLVIGNDLMRERFTPPEPGADRLPLKAIRLMALVQVVIGALDAGRWQLAPVSEPLRLAGLAGMVISSSVLILSMRANRFFSAVVRIQSDRGHRVVDAGPYGLVRHPGYLGMILAVPCGALALGSWLGVALAVAYAALIVRRVLFEDGFLAENLSGYREYAGRVRYRLVPGAW